MTNKMKKTVMGHLVMIGKGMAIQRNHGVIGVGMENTTIVKGIEMIIIIWVQA